MKNSNHIFLDNSLECIELKGTNFTVEPLFYDGTHLIYINYIGEDRKPKSVCVYGNKNFKLTSIE